MGPRTGALPGRHGRLEPRAERAELRRDALMFAPAAFLRRGSAPDPRDVDSRSGETEEWVT